MTADHNRLKPAALDLAFRLEGGYRDVEKFLQTYSGAPKELLNLLFTSQVAQSVARRSVEAVRRLAYGDQAGELATTLAIADYVSLVDLYIRFFKTTENSPGEPIVIHELTAADNHRAPLDNLLGPRLFEMGIKDIRLNSEDVRFFADLLNILALRSIRVEQSGGKHSATVYTSHPNFLGITLFTNLPLPSSSEGFPAGDPVARNGGVTDLETVHLLSQLWEEPMYKGRNISFSHYLLTGWADSPMQRIICGRELADHTVASEITQSFLIQSALNKWDIYSKLILDGQSIRANVTEYERKLVTTINHPSTAVIMHLTPVGR